jgi:SAM-dependent methyltransferase
MPSPASLSGQSSGTRSSQEDRLNPPPGTRTYWVLVYLRQAVEAFVAAQAHRLSGATVVDLGCGNMPYAPLFVTKGARYIGADFYENDLADQKIGPDGRVGLGDGTADIVISTQVLEHVADPAAYLRECRRLLTPDGLLFLSTHGMWPFHPDPVDYWRWTATGLAVEVGRAGFWVNELTPILRGPAAATQLWQDYMIPLVHWRLQALFVKATQALIGLQARRAARSEDAAVYAIVATPTRGGEGEA